MPDLADELRALRERAYGPGADIHGDPAALQRLHELEGLVLVGAGDAASVDHDVAVVDPVTDAGTQSPHADGLGGALPPSPGFSDTSPDPSETDAAAPGTPTSPAPSDPSEESEESGAEVASAPWWRTRRTLLWLGALVVAVALAVAATVWVMQGRAHAVAVLSVDEDGEWPRDFFGQKPEGALLFEDFFGLTVLVLPEVWGGRATTSCLYVIETTTPNQMVSTVACSAGDFPPTAGLAVPPAAPEAMLDRFPEGTALQFVQRGPQVFVYSHAP